MDEFDMDLPPQQRIEAIRWVLSQTPLVVFLHALDVLEREDFMSSKERNSLVTIATRITQGE